MSYHPDTVIHSDWLYKTPHINGLPEPCWIMVDKQGIFSDHLPNVYIQAEPEIIIPNRDYLLHNYHRYHIILTFNADILNNCPNAIKYVCATTWILEEHYNKIDTSLKQYKISTLASLKNVNNAEGHLFRKRIHESQLTLLTKFPITYFRSSVHRISIHDYNNNPLLYAKEQLFDTFQFAIVIENSKQQNYFTEKIIDCILTKTIPIYWGCPNISEYFDISGWIVLETTSLDELIEKLKQLTPDYYDKYYDIINKNYNIALNYTCFCTNISNAISNIKI